MDAKNTVGNKCSIRNIDLNNKEDLEFLDWVGMNNEENKKLIEEGNLLFFEEPYALEGVSVVDIKNNECVVIEYRSL